MRITNKMMNNNSLSNINKNKEYLDRLNTQMASEKKIVRPSDDPVVAIRALKLRSNVTEITQYYERNTNDADAWLTATQDALESTKTILMNMKSEFTSGATGTNTVASRTAILDELKALKNQIYDDGNADYAGRHLFTGFRTGSSLTFKGEDVAAYDYTDIVESFSKADVLKVSYVSGKLDSAADVAGAATLPVQMQQISTDDYSRIRLAYNDIDKGSLDEIKVYETDNKGNKTVKDTYSVQTLDVNSYASYDEYMDNVYRTVTADPAAAIFVPETGEVIIGKSLAKDISNLKDTDTLEVKYDKAHDTWKEGDLKPEHYFDCVRKDIVTNEEVEFDTHDHSVEYDISSNQSMQINTNASEVFLHGIGRDIDEMISAIEKVNEASRKIDALTSKLEDTSLSDTERKNIQTTLDAANKEFDMVNSKMQKMFESGQTSFAGYYDRATLAATTVGTRIQRIDLVRNRLMDLKTTAQDLADENENVEITDIAIQASEAKITYNAALMATGQLSQQTLLSYI